MLTVKWTLEQGWQAPEIKPYGPLQLDPSSTVLHYAAELFEGMKAYRDKQGRCRLFRPDLNMRRMNSSAKRLAFPTFDGEVLTDLIKELVRVDERFVPDEEGCSLCASSPFPLDSLALSPPLRFPLTLSNLRTIQTSALL